MAQCLEASHTLNDEDNLLHCIFGQSDVFGTVSYENCSDKRRQLVEKLTAFANDSEMSSRLIEPYLLWFASSFPDWPHFQDYKVFEKKKKEDFKRDLDKKLEAKDCKKAMMQFQESTTDEGVIKFVQSCASPLALQSIEQSLADFKKFDYKKCVNECINHILNERNKLTEAVLPLAADEFELTIHLYKETDSQGPIL